MHPMIQFQFWLFQLERSNMPPQVRHRGTWNKYVDIRWVSLWKTCGYFYEKPEKNILKNYSQNEYRNFYLQWFLKREKKSEIFTVHQKFFKNFMDPFLWTQGYRSTTRRHLKFLLLISLTLAGWKAEQTMEPPVILKSGPLDWEFSTSITTPLKILYTILSSCNFKYFINILEMIFSNLLKLTNLKLVSATF